MRHFSEVVFNSEAGENPKKIFIREGATVVSVESFDHDWRSANLQRSDGSIVKLDLWKLEEYDKVLFLDVTSVLFHPIHEIFENPVTAMRTTTNPTADMPKSYMIAAQLDSSMSLDTQLVLGKNKMDDGFFILSPSENLYNYYISLLRLLDEHDFGRSEQILLNQAHRADGPMPWQDLGFGWSSKHASQSDYETGLKSVNHEWWRPIADEFIRDRIAMAIDERLAYLNH
ncbi:hypothetical protein N7504_010856 [Penicillium tannophilum]|nr:hypothetical protein N7504_010856 [Penicillium tannophilum]